MQGFMTWEDLVDFFFGFMSPNHGYGDSVPMWGWNGILLSSIMVCLVFCMIALLRRDRFLCLLTIGAALLPLLIGMVAFFERITFCLFIRAELLDVVHANFSAGHDLLFFPMILAGLGSLFLTVLSCLAIARSRPATPQPREHAHVD